MKRFLALACIFFVFSSGAAFAKTSALTYDVYAGGIHALNARLILKTESSKYDTILTAGTQGFLKKMANWSGKYISKGVVKSNKLLPTLHESSSTWKDKTETKTFKYDGKGNFKSYKSAEAGVETTPQDIDLSLAKGTTDILSATFQMMMGIPKSKVCNGQDLIFDGDRNFRLMYSGSKIETFTKSDYNIYEGSAISCQVEVKPEKGKWRKKPRGWLSIQEQGRKKGELPTIWFGQIKGQPDFYVPVKIRVKTDYGTLFMHLTSAKTW